MVKQFFASCTYLYTEIIKIHFPLTNVFITLMEDFIAFMETLVVSSTMVSAKPEIY